MSSSQERQNMCEWCNGVLTPVCVVVVEDVRDNGVVVEDVQKTEVVVVVRGSELPVSCKKCWIV